MPPPNSQTGALQTSIDFIYGSTTIEYKRFSLELNKIITIFHSL